MDKFTLTVFALLVAASYFQVAFADPTTTKFRATLTRNSINRRGAFGKVDLLVDTSEPLVELSLHWNFRRLSPKTNYSIVVGSAEDPQARLRCKSFNVELASEPLAKFVTDANGKASGSLSIMSGIEHILNDQNATVTSADLHGRPLALIANDNGQEKCSLIKRVRGSTNGKETKVPSRRQQRKNKNKNPSSDSDGVGVLPVDSDSNQSTESELTCTDIDCGKMKCAMFNSKDGDFTSFEPRCVAPSQITCENVMCIAEMQCFQKYGQEPTCIMVGLGDKGFA